MTQRIETLRTNLEKYAVYRFFRAIHNWIIYDFLDEVHCAYIPMWMGLVLWPVAALLCLFKGLIAGGIVFTLIYALYWLHLILFEEG